MAKEPINIQVDHEGMQYTGWATPSDKEKDDKPASFHVILNDVMFGNVSFNGSNWVVDEQRPQPLTDKVGNALKKYI